MGPEIQAEPGEDVLLDSAYPRLAEVAESVRWKIAEVPWSTFDGTRVTPALKALVRDMAFFELATYSATQRFMQAFPDDLDLTQWLSVWFYEETKHPLALMRWLSLAGERCDPAFVSRGRVSSPFVKSRMGTLVFNILSEITAAAAYTDLSKTSPEPLLSSIARRIGGDESRHAATFFEYARRRLGREKAIDRERLEAVKVLHFWLNESANVTHPVNQTMQKARALQEELGVRPDVGALTDRSCRVIGALLGERIEGPADVEALLFALTAKVHAGA